MLPLSSGAAIGGAGLGCSQREIKKFLRFLLRFLKSLTDHKQTKRRLVNPVD